MALIMRVDGALQFAHMFAMALFLQLIRIQCVFQQALYSYKI